MAEAFVRSSHVVLLKMAIDDPILADVWPLTETGLSKERRRQYLYTNLIMQQVILEAREVNHTEAQIERTVRRLFMSPIIREYWQNTKEARMDALEEGTSEFQFSQLADRIWHEYESVVAFSKSEPTKTESWWSPLDRKVA